MLTHDMACLCGEILAMRRARGNLMSDIQHDTKGRSQAVAELCADFGSARTAMAKRTKNDRVAFLGDLKRVIGSQRQEMRDDLAGARRAWAGMA